MSAINLIDEYKQTNDYNQKYINKKLLLNKLLDDPEIKGIIMKAQPLGNPLDNLVIECLKRNEMDLDKSINDFIHQSLTGNSDYSEILNGIDILSGHKVLTPVERVEPSNPILAERHVSQPQQVVQGRVVDTVKQQVLQAQPVKSQQSNLVDDSIGVMGGLTSAAADIIMKRGT